MDGAFAGCPPRCDPTCGQRVGATLDETELQDAQVHASGGENVGVFHVHNLLGNVNRSRRASGSRVSPPLRGGSGAVLPTQRRLRGRGTSLLRSGDAAPGRGALGRARPEAGSDSFVLSFEQCETHIARSHRVNVTLLEGVSSSSPCCRTAYTSHTSHTSHACDTGVHDAMRGIQLGRNSVNSFNSRGDTEAGGQRFCVPGGTKSLSTCTRTGVRRPAVEKRASPQQASLKLHEETWAGLLQNQGLGISQEVEIVSGCAVRVARPLGPDYYPEPPGRGIVIRNRIGWSLLEKTEVWGMVVPGCLPRRESFFST